jgi:hypothetical protein
MSVPRLQIQLRRHRLDGVRAVSFKLVIHEDVSALLLPQGSFCYRILLSEEP